MTATPKFATPKFAHVVLQTRRLDEIRDWCCTVLDAHVGYEGHGLCFATFDEEHHRIAFLGAPIQLDPKSPTAAGMHHTAYTFDTLDDLLDRYEARPRLAICRSRLGRNTSMPSETRELLWGPTTGPHRVSNMARYRRRLARSR